MPLPIIHTCPVTKKKYFFESYSIYDLHCMKFHKFEIPPPKKIVKDEYIPPFEAVSIVRKH